MIDRKDLLDYEIKSSWVAPLVSWEPLQELLARYFAWKVRRKHRRYHYVCMQENKRNIQLM